MLAAPAGSERSEGRAFDGRQGRGVISSGFGVKLAERSAE